MTDTAVHDEKARLDDLRLQCLKLAAASDDVHMNRVDVIPQAQSFFDYVTNAPKRPELFAVRRIHGAEAGDYPSLGPLDHLGRIGGSMVWTHAHNAYHFRSKAEAETAITKYKGHLGGVMVPEPLPEYMELF